MIRQSVACLELYAFGGQFARLGDDVVRQIEYTVPFLDVESRDRDQRVSFRLPFDPRLELSSGLRLKGVAVTISASDWPETFRIAEERREAGEIGRASCRERVCQYV